MHIVCQCDVRLQGIQHLAFPLCMVFFHSRPDCGVACGTLSKLLDEAASCARHGGVNSAATLARCAKGALGTIVLLPGWLSALT